MNRVQYGSAVLGRINQHGTGLVRTFRGVMARIIMNANEFIREVYLASEPSVDLTMAESIDCTKHRLSVEKYEELLAEFAGDDADLKMQCNMWCLCSGPQLYV